MVKKLKQRLRNQRGFTLVELLAVIVILGIIAAIAVPSIGNIIAKSKYDAAKSEAIQAIESARLYISSEGPTDNNEYDDAILGEYMETPSYWTGIKVTYNTTNKTFTFTGTKTKKFDDNPPLSGKTKAEIEESKYNKKATDNSGS